MHEPPIHPAVESFRSLTASLSAALAARGLVGWLLGLLIRRWFKYVENGLAKIAEAVANGTYQPAEPRTSPTLVGRKSEAPSANASRAARRPRPAGNDAASLPNNTPRSRPRPKPAKPRRARRPSPPRPAPSRLRAPSPGVPRRFSDGESRRSQILG
jgi:hypothetical protein